MKYYIYGNCHYLVDTEPENDVITSYTVIQVTDVRNHYEIGIRRKSAIQDCKEISRSEFYDRFHDVLDQIKGMMGEI